MTTLELRNKLIQFVQQADEEFLKKIDAFLNSKQSSADISEKHKAILDQRLENHKANPEAGRNWSEIKSELAEKYRV